MFLFEHTAYVICTYFPPVVFAHQSTGFVPYPSLVPEPLGTYFSTAVHEEQLVGKIPIVFTSGAISLEFVTYWRILFVGESPSMPVVSDALIQ